MVEMWPRLRTVLFWVRLTIGVAAGLPILVMCTTGALRTYQIQRQQLRPAIWLWSDRVTDC